MHGLIGRLRAHPGKRDELAAILLENRAMPGCINYIVAHDPSDPDAVWVTEVWQSEASHKASLSMPSVINAITRGRPLIAGFDKYIETLPIGGIGID